MSETTAPDGEDVPAGSPDALELQVAGAMSRQHARDAGASLSHLAGFLTGTLGEAAVQVQRAGLFGGDRRPVRRIEVEFGDAAGGKATRYVLEQGGGNGRGGLAATRTQVVRGVALKTDPLSIEDWMAAVGTAIASEADRNKAARDALRDLL